MNKIIFDWKRTLYDPDKKSLINGALELLNYLQEKNISLILIGKGGTDMYEEVNRLKVKKYFSNIIFIDKKKNVDLFKKYLSKDGSRSTLVIGDRVRSEIEIGNTIGSITVWLKQGKFSNELPIRKNQVPQYTVDSLAILKSLIKKIIK